MGGGTLARLGVLTVLGLAAFAGTASAAEYLAGGGFEGGTIVIEEEVGGATKEYVDHPSWQESDTQYESPICSTSIFACGGGIGSPQGPRGGQSWALFGAYAGTDAHIQSVSQSITLPAVEGGAISFYVWVREFQREASLSVKFDQQTTKFEDDELLALGPGYQLVTVLVGQVEAGPHEVSLRFVSDATSSAMATTLSVDDVSFAARPVWLPPKEIQKPRQAFLPIETTITKQLLYTAKAGKTGSAKNPRRPSLYKATQGKSGKPAKAKFFFTGSGGEGELRFECKLDDAGYRPCTSPRFYKKLKLGQHTFQVRAVDRAGNRDETPARYEFKAKQGSSGKTK